MGRRGRVRRCGLVRWAGPEWNDQLGRGTEMWVALGGA